ncbi:MAG: HAMP domain-containing protein [Roseiflexaceae bacterium]|nr:HAMP domain-containing protein [Roseiflexaceae bacterium]
MRSIRSKLLFVAVTTTMLTVAIISTLLLVVIRLDREWYGGEVEAVILAWQQRAPEFTLNLIGSNQRGYIADGSGRIVFASGGADAACALGTLVSACMPDEAAIPDNGRTIVRDGTVWHEFRQPLRDGVIAYAQVQPDIFRGLANDVGETILPLALVAILGALPLALILSIATVRPLAQQLQRISAASRRFASGDLDARTNERGQDEIGELSQQFDTMATTISGQVHDLRALVAQNSALALSAEASARVAERAILSRDLHDTVAQHLFSLAMGTADLAALIRRDPEQAAQQAQQLAAIASDAQAELREVLTWLRPNRVVERGLTEALNELVNAWRERTHGQIQLDVTFAPAPLPLLIESVLFRVCQEALANISRHAAARSVAIKLTCDAREVVLDVRDDGRGFDPSAPAHGFGLIGMSERVRAVRGVLQVTSRPGAGTVVRATIPVTIDHEEPEQLCQ